MKAILPRNLHSTILDIGCGFGQTMQALGELGYTNVFGIDISDEAVAFGVSKHLKISKIDDIRNFYAPDGKKFDFIMMNHVLEHLSKSDIIETLRHIHDHLLEENGEFLVLVPNAQSNTNCYWAYEDFTHSTLFTSGSIYYVLMASGFDSIRYLDIDGLHDSKGFKKTVRKALLWIYKTNLLFWNAVTLSAYHKPSPMIFTYEIKVLAGKNACS